MYLEADDHDNIKSAIRSTADMDSKAMQFEGGFAIHPGPNQHLAGSGQCHVFTATYATGD